MIQLVNRSAQLLLLVVLATAVNLRASAEETGQLRAEDAPLFSEQIVVVATGTEARIESVGSSVTVVTRAQIEARGATSVLEVLRTVPGVEVVQGGGPGRVATVLIRGASSSQTLVLLDGVRLNSANTGAYDLADLRADQVERIEIVRGPQASLYGSEAIGGVVSIITRRGSPGLSAAATADVGNLGFGRLAAWIGGQDRRVDYRLNLSREGLDGVSVASETAGNHEADPYRNLSALGSLGVSLGRGGRLDLTVDALSARADLDGFAWGVGPTDDPNAVQDRRAVVASARLDSGGGNRWRYRLSAALNREDLRGSDPDTPSNVYRIMATTAEFAVRSDLTVAENDVVSVGASLEERRGENVGSYDRKVRIASLFAENQWSAGKGVAVTAAVRRDTHDAFGGKTTFRLTGSFGFADGGGRLHGSWGTGFKAPTLVDLYYPFYGNLNLRPETSHGLDLGIEGRFADDRLRVDVTAFANRFDDLISWDGQTYTANNVATAKASGVEATLVAETGEALQLSASYTLTDSEDLSTGVALARRPRHRFAASAFLRQSARLSGSVTVIVVLDRIESDGRPMEDYSRLDAHVEYKITDLLAAHLRVENLLDAQYEEVIGFTSPGRLTAAGVTLHL